MERESKDPDSIPLSVLLLLWFQNSVCMYKEEEEEEEGEHWSGFGSGRIDICIYSVICIRRHYYHGTTFQTRFHAFQISWKRERKVSGVKLLLKLKKKTNKKSKKVFNRMSAASPSTLLPLSFSLLQYVPLQLFHFGTLCLLLVHIRTLSFLLCFQPKKERRGGGGGKA